MRSCGRTAPFRKRPWLLDELHPLVRQPSVYPARPPEAYWTSFAIDPAQPRRALLRSDQGQGPLRADVQRAGARGVAQVAPGPLPSSCSFLETIPRSLVRGGVRWRGEERRIPLRKLAGRRIPGDRTVFER